MTLVLRIALIAVLVSMGASGQRLVVESDTVEGLLLQQIDAEENADKKLILLEKFAKDYPNHEAITWVLAHLQSVALKNKNFDRVLELAIRILGTDPDDVAAAHNALRAVEQRADVELIKRWAALTSTTARRVFKSKTPEDPEEVEDWKARVEFARQVETYTEYALYHAAVTSKDSRTRSELVETLEQRNPKSEYLAQMRTSEAAVVRQVDVEEAVRSVEEAYRAGKYHVDQLYMAAAYYMQRRTSPEKVITYGTKVLDLLENGSRPEEMSEADWARRRQELVGQTNWMVGLIYSTQERFAQADKHLRAALTQISDNDMVAGALYHLGYVNYKMAESGDRIRIHDAVRFTTECAKISSAVQAQATENLKAMKAEYGLTDEILSQIEPGRTEE
jgi:tetratricopeptide (TPR) repeat protein